MAQRTSKVAIVGGTGGLGRGLAARWARAGVDVAIGSRDAERAAEALVRVSDALAGVGAGGGVAERGKAPSSGTNLEVVRDAEVVVLAVPFGGLDASLGSLAPTLAGRVVLSVINPLAFDDDGPRPLEVEEGSAAQRIAANLPASRVVAGLHSVSSRHLLRLADPLDDDVPLVGDDEDAVAQVAALVDLLDGCRAVPVGPLRLARPLEELTCVLLSVNQRNRTHAGVRFTRL